MINEPNVNQAFYTDAVLIVQAEAEEQAYELIAAQAPGWVVDELKRLKPKIIEASQPSLIFADVRGD
jgi:polynucleotide 5'-kinase involved in rRNA processing